MKSPTLCLGYNRAMKMKSRSLKSLSHHAYLKDQCRWKSSDHSQPGGSNRETNKACHYCHSNIWPHSSRPVLEPPLHLTLFPWVHLRYVNRMLLGPFEQSISIDTPMRNRVLCCQFWRVMLRPRHCRKCRVTSTKCSHPKPLKTVLLFQFSF